MRRVVVVLAAALVLSGCAGASGGYPAATAEDLQNRVLAVTEAASEGELETALTRLDELAASATDALARGTVTEARHGSIVSAIELVRADLEALIQKKADDGEDAEEPVEEPAPDAGTEGEDVGNSGSSSENSGGGNSGEGNSGEGDSGNDNSGGGDGGDQTEEPAEEEPAEEEPAEEEPAEEEPAEEEPEPEPEPEPAPTKTPKPTATVKPTSPPANG
jgi:hypothetical protein